MNQPRFRMSRWEFLARFFRAAPRARSKREPRAKAKMRTWLIAGLTFTAFTKSEARSQAKASFKIPRKGRLPVGITIQEAT